MSPVFSDVAVRPPPLMCAAPPMCAAPQCVWALDSLNPMKTPIIPISKQRPRLPALTPQPPLGRADSPELGLGRPAVQEVSPRGAAVRVSSD